MADKPRIKLPKEAAKGEVIQIKTLVSHVMESGQRKDAQGKPIPRRIINKFTCEFNGKPVFACAHRPIPTSSSMQEDEAGTFKFA